MLSWDSAEEKASTTNVVFYYKDIRIKWKLEHAWELSFSYVTIRSDTLVFDNPTSDLYRHCHYAQNLAGGNITGTSAIMGHAADAYRAELLGIYGLLSLIHYIESSNEDCKRGTLRIGCDNDMAG